MRTSPIQLAMPMSIWSVADHASRTIRAINARSSAKMPRVDVDARARLEQPAEREQRAGAAPDVVATAAPVTPSFGNGPEAEDQQRPEHDVDRVREPQHAHRDRRVARAAEDRVDQEQHHDRDVAAEHDARVRACPIAMHVGRRAHHAEQPRREQRAEHAEHERDGRRRAGSPARRRAPRRRGPFSPMRRATIADAPMARPMASA